MVTGPGPRPNQRPVVSPPPPTPNVTIPHSSSETGPKPWDENSSSDGVDYIPAGLEMEVPELEDDKEEDYTPVGHELEIPEPDDSEGDEVQILEPPPIPVVDLVTEEEGKVEEEGDLELPPASEEDTEPAEEEDLGVRNTEENTESETAALARYEHHPCPPEEIRVRVRAESKWVSYFGRKRKTAKQTRIESSLSPERPRIEIDDEGYEG
jgi:hypothetical protein